MGGNVYITQIDRTAAALYPNELHPKHGSLALFKQGTAPRLALQVKYDLQGASPETKRDGEMYDGDATGVNQLASPGWAVFPPVSSFPFSNASFAVLLASSRIEATPTEEEPDPEPVPGLRCSYQFRWWPGDWNSITFAFGEYRRVGTEPWVLQEYKKVEYGGSPLKDLGPAPSNFRFWKKLPPAPGEVFVSTPPTGTGIADWEQRCLVILWPPKPEAPPHPEQVGESWIGLDRCFIPGLRPYHADYRFRLLQGEKQTESILPEAG